MEDETVSSSLENNLGSNPIANVVKISITKQNQEQTVDQHRETDVDSDKIVDRDKNVDSDKNVDNIKNVDTVNDDNDVINETTLDSEERCHEELDDVDVVENVIKENGKVKDEFELDSKLNGREIGRIWIFGYGCDHCNFAATSRQLLKDHTVEIHYFSGTVKAA